MNTMENTASQGTAGCKPLTTFVHTDTNMLWEFVQRLTGQGETNGTKELEETKVAGARRTTSKLHERRQYRRPKLEIVKPNFPLKSSASTNQHSLFPPSKSRNYSVPPSPISGNSSSLSSPLTPSTIFSRLCILDEEKRREPMIPELNREEEEKAIKERRFICIRHQTHHHLDQDTLNQTCLLCFPLNLPRQMREYNFDIPSCFFVTLTCSKLQIACQPEEKMHFD